MAIRVNTSDQWPILLRMDGQTCFKRYFSNPYVVHIYLTKYIHTGKICQYILIRMFILDLKPASRYEATIAAQNAEDWSRHSRIYHFSTFGAGMINVQICVVIHTAILYLPYTWHIVPFCKAYVYSRLQKQNNQKISMCFLCAFRTNYFRNNIIQSSNLDLLPNVLKFMFANCQNCIHH